MATVYDCGHLTGEDDFSAILGCRLLGLIFERYWNFLLFAGHWLLCVFLLKTISVRSVVIDCLALYLKGTEIFLLLKTISVRYLVIDCLALYLKGTEIFLFCRPLAAVRFFG